MHLAPLIYDLAIILAVAGFISAVFLKIKQPVVLGYILAGLIVGPYTPPFQLITDIPSIQTLAELGVIFLMFTLGLEFSFRKLLSVGATASIAAILEVLFFVIVGFFLGRSFGWTDLEGLFLGSMLAISSTTIIIKALDELKLKTHRFASLIFGILIVEDLLAILLLVSLTTIAETKSFSILSLAGTSLNLLGVTASWFLIGHLVIPKLMTYFARKGSNELITLISIGLCLSLVVIGTKLGYSAALGAFIMGSILAESSIIHQIEGLMAPLKDLFGAIFFVSVGMLIDPVVIWEYKELIGLLCVVTITGKIFITSFGAIISGQNVKNSLQVGFGLAQIGEFSFIIAGIGLSLKAINPILQPIAVAVSCVTTFTTPYLIKYSGPIADKLEKNLPLKITKALAAYGEWWGHLNGLSSIINFIPSLKDIMARLEKKEKKDPLSQLAPWDRHLYTFTVHPNAVLVNKTIFESGLRRTAGINIVALRRGHKTIIAPGANEKILPHDSVIVLGSDEQLDLAREQLEVPESTIEISGKTESYVLKNYTISAESLMTGQTLESSGLRERHQALIVGIERDGNRLMNPARDFVMKQGDIIWIVGEKSKLDEIQL